MTGYAPFVSTAAGKGSSTMPRISGGPALRHPTTLAISRECRCLTIAAGIGAAAFLPFRSVDDQPADTPMAMGTATAMEMATGTAGTKGTGTTIGTTTVIVTAMVTTRTPRSPARPMD